MPQTCQGILDLPRVLASSWQIPEPPPLPSWVDFPACVGQVLLIAWPTCGSPTLPLLRVLYCLSQKSPQILFRLSFLKPFLSSSLSLLYSTFPDLNSSRSTSLCHVSLFFWFSHLVFSPQPHLFLLSRVSFSQPRPHPAALPSYFFSLFLWKWIAWIEILALSHTSCLNLNRLCKPSMPYLPYL